MIDGFILGWGFVGKATGKSLGIKDHFSRSDSNITLEEGAKKKFCFICLPTPTDEKGEQTEARKVIHDYIQQLKGYNDKLIFVIRSTVLPGTCRAFHEEFGVRVVSNPEFLSEDTWEEDAIHPRIICMGADDDESKQAIEGVWKGVLTKIEVVTDTVTSETLKYAFNTFFLTKIIWANQIFDICKQNGAEYRVIREALHQHPWGSKHHLKALHKDGRGGGGHCFPKDVKAFSTYGNSKLLKLVDELNDEYLKASGKK
jgi:nucleotide sugar dehydrogenase